jgi:DNA polymerase IV
MTLDVNENMLGFCRDCLTVISGDGRRCVSCGSPRLLLHNELNSLAISHVDCDAFYASVEKRDDPSLVDKPVIIGGGKRGVVSTACYIARIYGVRSAMPMFKALDLCPHAVVIKPNMEKYGRVGREVRALMLEMTPLVEPISIDEAFLDLSGTQLLHRSPASYTLAKFAKRVQSEIGISVSVGLSYCKFLAKIASDMEKPRGFSIIGREEAVAYLGALPVSKIWGVGKAFEASLNGDGITMIAQLQSMDETALMKRYGVMGQRLTACHADWIRAR